MQEIKLEAKLVGDIKGHFIIPSYQRGYRWSEDEVRRLLMDISDISKNGSKSYCLQPIVVKRTDDKYELIDGQQRLTTLYLIYSYMNIFSNGFMKGPKFSLEYQTREKSGKFLQSIDLSMKEENIDFWFMCQAYETISDWFKDKDTSVLTKFNEYLSDNVKIIWYEVDESEDSIALFTRLNIGKIPLSSAELVKAMFLSKNSNAEMDRRKQEEISLQWDNIERDLHQDALWYFLANSSAIEYQTRIDLILDLIVQKPSDTRDKYYTFFKFDEMQESQCLEEIWRKIQHTFLVLKDWYEDHAFYHKIGYLIASNAESLQTIYDLSMNKTKTAFKALLDNLIKKSVEIDCNYAELSYEKAKDYKKISTLLLLFNVESIRQIDEQVQRFPLDRKSVV